MLIMYIHGVKIRSPRWFAPKLAVRGAAVDYVPVYWGDVTLVCLRALENRDPACW